jgi:diketogulonate reductase-like aldo/keto reductase
MQVTPPLQDTWKEMESLVKEGLVRSIGVSNFSVPKLIRIMEQAEIKPAVNQVEVHPYHRNDNLIQWCQGNGIHVTAYSPLGSPDSAVMFRRSASTPVLLEDPVVKDIAATVGKSPGQARSQPSTPPA